MIDSSKKSWNLCTTLHTSEQKFKAMGRRAKTKQAAPIPLYDPKDNRDQPSPRKLGKRKANLNAEDGAHSSRPVKKVKETESGGIHKAKSKSADKPNDTLRKRNGKGKASKGKVLGSDGGSSEGWEDVEDEIDLKVQAK